jgi:hypothetical protein
MAGEGDADEREADFRRVLEASGERWLSFHEAVVLLREREPMSVGQAQAMIDDLRMAYFADGGQFARQSGKSATVRFHWFHDTDFLTNKPKRGNTFISEADLIYWHAAPKTPASQTSTKQIRQTVTDYLRTDPNPTQDGAWKYAQKRGLRAQKQVRHEYRVQSDHPRVGRRRKSVKK